MATKQARSTKRVKPKHRAVKRTSVPAQAVGKGRDARKAERRAARNAELEAMAKEAQEAADQAAESLEAQADTDLEPEPGPA